MILNTYLPFYSSSITFLLFFQKRSDDAEWSDDSEEFVGLASAPTLLRSVRLRMINGSVDVGYSVRTDGFGNAEVCVTVILNYGSDYIILNEFEMADLFDIVRSVKNYHLIGSYRRIFNGNENSKNGEWTIKKQPGDTYIVIFTSNEGGIQTIPYFKHEDLMRLADLEMVIDGRMEYMNYGVEEIVERIEGYADKYKDKPSKILDVAACWSCDDLLVELATNFMQVFIEIIEETKKTIEEERKQQQQE